MKLIDKDALVAEIDRQKIGYNVDGKHSVEYNTTRKILNIIDTLEVKEMDLEKSISDWLSDGLPNDEELIDYIKETAEHFFELGLKSQKGE